jgi:predicted ATPase
MRITSLTISGVGGLADGTIALPETSVTAVAGANGTGKSKFLACILSPWSGQVPNPRKGGTAEVRVEIRLTLEERQALDGYSQVAGWGAVDIPETVRITVRRNNLTGTTRAAEPYSPVLDNFWHASEFLRRNPSLDILYLPAERRLLAPNQTGIDLNQLNDETSWQKTTESRNSASNYGRLDDQEFEQFAKALCVAHSLPDETDEPRSDVEQRVQWPAFESAVNALIEPKKLLPLSRSFPDSLRIRTATGDTHAVQDLSSGERQALIIMSRVLRAGGKSPLVLIDEPDAYLHPSLSRRLIANLELGVGSSGQLVVATHSPAILDALPPSVILRMDHETAPRVVADEVERLDLYREAGFRASALSQSNFLLVTEGESDVSLLQSLFAELSNATIRAAGGKARVVQQVEQLEQYEIPILGVVDRDLAESRSEISSSTNLCVWPMADIEGVFLSDEVVLREMISAGLIRPEFPDAASLQSLVESLCEAHRDNVIAEIAQSSLIAQHANQWPSSRGNDPIDRLRAGTDAMMTPTKDDVDRAIREATAAWDGHSGTKLELVRGKYVLNKFAQRASFMTNGQSLLEAVARRPITIAGMAEFASLLAEFG